MALRWYSSVNFVFACDGMAVLGRLGGSFRSNGRFYCHGIFVNGGDFFSYFPRAWAMGAILQYRATLTT